MIFVTVGTQPNGFLRCLKEVDQLIVKYGIKSIKADFRRLQASGGGWDRHDLNMNKL